MAEKKISYTDIAAANLFAVVEAVIHGSEETVIQVGKNGGNETESRYRSKKTNVVLSTDGRPGRERGVLRTKVGGQEVIVGIFDRATGDVFLSQGSMARAFLAVAMIDVEMPPEKVAPHMRPETSALNR